MAVELEKMGWTNSAPPALNKTNLEQMENNIENAINASLIKNVSRTLVTAPITQNTNYAIPEYTVGNNSLSIYFEGCKLIKDVNYIEIDSTHIQFKDWDVPNGSWLEIIITK